MFTKKNIKIAKSMFKKSLVNGLLNTTCAKLILEETIAQRPRNLINILKIYKRYVEAKTAQEELVLEVPQKNAKISKIEPELLKKTGAQKIIYKVNPQLVFGAKIFYVDWIIDATLDSKLTQLTTT